MPDTLSLHATHATHDCCTWYTQTQRKPIGQVHLQLLQAVQMLQHSDQPKLLALKPDSATTHHALDACMAMVCMTMPDVATCRCCKYHVDHHHIRREPTAYPAGHTPWRGCAHKSETRRHAPQTTTTAPSTQLTMKTHMQRVSQHEMISNNRMAAGKGENARRPTDAYTTRAASLPRGALSTVCARSR